MYNTLGIAFLLCSFLGTAFQQGLYAQSAPGLDSTVEEFTTTGESRLDALLRLGQREHIAFGIESVDRRLLTVPVAEKFTNRTVEQILSVLVPVSEGYSWQTSHGTVLITSVALSQASSNPFNIVVPHFDLDRPATLQEAANLLRMDLELQLHPNITGFLGTLNSGSLVRNIGPIHLVDVSVRDCLNRLIGTVRNAAWIAAAPPSNLQQTDPSKLWRIVEYDALPSNARYSQQLLDSAPFAQRPVE